MSKERKRVVKFVVMSHPISNPKRIALFLSLLLPLLLPAQTCWWVYFTDKKDVQFDPLSYFAPEAIERRVLHDLPLSDSTDFPVNENYLAAVASRVKESGYASRWLNAVEVVADEQQVQQLRSLPFVSAVEKSADSGWEITANHRKTFSGDSVTRIAGVLKQCRALQGQLFYNKGLDGTGVIVAILDVGFDGTLDNAVFSRVYKENRVTQTYDFVRKTEDVYTADDHGTMVFSCMAGIYEDSMQMGMAPGARYLLGRIAKGNGNQYLAESRWQAGMEWADKNGARIINNSGGPNDKSYFPEDMDGHTCPMSRSGNMAARKGMLVVSAAGNNGLSGHPFILSPADADSVLCVAAAMPKDGSCFRSDYSSYGPTPDLRAKPDVCAPGDDVVALSYEGYGDDQGTSFASPLTAGFAACVLQLHPEMKCMDLFAAIKRSGSLYPYFDYAHGTGYPQASYFLGEPKAPADSTFHLHSDAFTIWADIKDGVGPEENCTCPKLMYYNVSDANGRILDYHVIEVCNRKITLVNKGGGKLHTVGTANYTTTSNEPPQDMEVEHQEYGPGCHVNVFYEGHYERLDF